MECTWLKWHTGELGTRKRSLVISLPREFLSLTQQRVKYCIKGPAKQSSKMIYSRWWQLKHPTLGQIIQCNEHIFQMGWFWFNHQLVLQLGQNLVKTVHINYQFNQSLVSSSHSIPKAKQQDQGVCNHRILRIQESLKRKDKENIVTDRHKHYTHTKKALLVC